MDPRMLGYYNSELRHIREMGGEFAKAYPKIAGRLGLDGFECADPYVERLLEGFAFLAARVKLKIDSEYPEFTQHLLEMVYPHYLCPTPSMAVVEFQADPTEGSLAEGFLVPRHSVLRSLLGKGERTPCEYRTGHDVTLWPLQVSEARYLPTAASVATLGVADIPGVKAGIRLRLKATADLTFDQLALDNLTLFLVGPDDLPMRLYEQIIGNSVAVVARPKAAAHRQRVLAGDSVARVGFEYEEALLPHGRRSFQGYRLLQEYFAFPQRYLFFEIRGLAQAVRTCESDELEVIVLLKRADQTLENVIGAEHFRLFCAPAINLFPRRADRIHLSLGQHEYHVLPDRTRPLDFEVYDVTEAVGYGAGGEKQQEFLPFYSSTDRMRRDRAVAFYTLQRRPRLLSSRQRRHGPRSSYVGGEAFIALVDTTEAPYSGNLRQLSVMALCTNRDLPLHMSVGRGATDFTMESGAPVEAVRCIAGPSRPRPSNVSGATAWRVISHLSLNYLSLLDSEDTRDAAAMRDMLALYADTNDAPLLKQLEGLRSVRSHPVIRRIPLPGPITFGRGLQIALTCDEAGFEGTGVFLLGAVLEQFFARYVSINSFTETVIKTLDRGEVMRWPARIGQRHVL